MLGKQSTSVKISLENYLELKKRGLALSKLVDEYLTHLFQNQKQTREELQREIRNIEEEIKRNQEEKNRLDQEKLDKQELIKTLQSQINLLEHEEEKRLETIRQWQQKLADDELQEKMYRMV